MTHFVMSQRELIIDPGLGTKAHPGVLRPSCTCILFTLFRHVEAKHQFSQDAKIQHFSQETINRELNVVSCVFG